MIPANNSDAYTYVKGTITVPNTAAADADANNANEKVVFKNWTPLANFIREINNMTTDKAKDLNVLMSMYNLIEYNYNYSKTFGILW